MDYIICKFQKTGIPYFRLNSEDIDLLSIEHTIEEGTLLSYENDGYNLRNVRSVYFRRAPTVFNDAFDPEDNFFINRERKHFFEGLFLSIDAKWINPMFATIISERKIFQLRVAKQIGFRIPKTLYSNYPGNIDNFLSSNKHGSIIKPISNGLQVKGKEVYSIYTSEVQDTSWLNILDVFESPLLFQERIPNYKDIRVTCVGKKLFSVEISKTDSSIVDWRRPDVQKSYKLHKLPCFLERDILKFQNSLNLIYSAIDFILTPDGEYVFLEVNPCGEWVWLEIEHGIEICHALIEELISFSIS